MVDAGIPHQTPEGLPGNTVENLPVRTLQLTRQKLNERADVEKRVFVFCRHLTVSLLRKVRCVKARRVWKLTWNVGR